ncbi:MAG: HAD-IC family P-type ATPase [Rhodoferax sp.]|nr:HAD-IC family P-type ATPase [Rhodoferax sp.]
MTDSPPGLDEAAVQARRDRGEVNSFVEPTSRGTWAIVRANVFTRFNALLGSLFALMLVLGPWQDALFGGVLVINALIGIAQELRAKQALDSLAVLSQTRAKVVRSGRTVEIEANDIVLDEVFLLTAGDQVLVDAVVLLAEELELDESLLSGEAASVAKHAGDEVLSGSLVTAGTAHCRATRVGAASHVHGLTTAARQFSLSHSELRDGTNRILRYVTWAIVPTAVLLVASQLGLHMPLADALRFSVGGLVAMVPEGLVLLTSAALGLGAIRLARRRTLVQDLPAVETLARIDTLCLDKTGTLTERDPELLRVEWLADEVVGTQALAALAAADPHPNTTLQAIARAHSDPQAPAPDFAVPFSSSRKWAGAHFATLGTWLLGAPEVLLQVSDNNAAVHAQAQTLAQAGYRVLLLARTSVKLVANQPPEAVVPIGLLVLAERLRPDAAATLRYFREQGISVKVISGDNPATVGQVVQHLGAEVNSVPVDARQMPADPAALAEFVATHSVFGRAMPEHKRALIAALQSKGHIVAMVGDGANDILGLKQADVGIAMGTGTSAARAVSQLVLLDNAFASLPSVVAEGRRVIGNVERVASLFLTKTVYATLLAFAVGIADVTFPFLPRHLTLIGALTIGIPGFFLSLERNSDSVKSGFVERVLRFSLPAGFIAGVATFATYGLLSGPLGASIAQARTSAAVVLFAVATLIVAMASRPPTVMRSSLIASVCVAFVVTLGWPVSRRFFALEPLGGAMWIGMAVIGAAAGCLVLWSLINPKQWKPRHSTEAQPPAQTIVTWFLRRTTPKWFLVSAALLVLGGTWLFFGMLEDVISGDPLVVVDATVYHAIQSLRTPVVDRFMVGLTELGDVQVVIPVILIALGWFIAHRLWRTAIYWLAAVGVAEALVKVIKLTLHRHRPGALYAGIVQFSFPSGHATLSVVVYGFLAFLLAVGAAQRFRVVIGSAAAILIFAIGSSRIYLGAHWMSDVLAGFSFGTAWITALAISYVYQGRQAIRPGRLAVAVLAAFAIAATIHIATNHEADLVLYAAPR